MKGIVFFILTTLAVAGYAADDASSAVLYEAYSRYHEEVTADNLVAVAGDYFSPSLLGSEILEDPDSVGQLLFKDYMASQDSHHEALFNNEGCLVVNGYDREGEPVVFSIKYMSGEDSWLMSGIHVAFVGSSSDFADRAKCPSEYAI